MTSPVIQAAERAREASHGLALATRSQKDRALHAMADALVAEQDEILAANAEDVARAEAGGTPPNIVDRLRLTTERLVGMAQGLRDVAGLPDPVGEVVRGSTLASSRMPGIRTPLKCTGEKSIHRPDQLISQPMTPVKTGMVRK